MFIIAINYFPYLYEHKLVRDKNTSFLLKRKKKKKLTIECGFTARVKGQVNILLQIPDKTPSQKHSLLHCVKFWPLQLTTQQRSRPENTFSLGRHIQEIISLRFIC